MLWSVPLLAYRSPFTVTWDDAPLKLNAGSSLKTDVVIGVPAGHFLYKDKTELSFTALDGVQVKSIQYPQSVVRNDKITGHASDVYPEGEAVISVTLLAPHDLEAGAHEIAALLEFQGCEERLCLRPEVYNIVWKLDIEACGGVGSTPTGDEGRIEADGFSLSSLLDVKRFEDVIAHGRYVAIFIAFIAGLLTAFTPCVWPMIPITLLVIGVHKKGNVLSNLLLAVSLAAGIAVTYAGLGVLAASAGSQIGFLFHSRIFLGFIVLLLFAMALSMFGVFNFGLPPRILNLFAKIGGQGYRGAFLSGISLGFMATPCAGPVLAPMFIWVAAQRQYLFGVQLFAAYAFGIGIFYILIGTFYGTLSGRIKSVRIGNMIKKVIGVALLAVALYYLNSLIPYGKVSGGIEWRSDETASIVEAATADKPLMIIFGAKWCPPCVELKRRILNDGAIVDAAKGVIPLYIDATSDTDEIKRVLDKYNVIGWPTILFAAPDGKIYDDLGVVGRVPSVEEMAAIINEAARRNK